MIFLISRVSLPGENANIVISVIAPKLVIYFKLTAESTAAKNLNFLNSAFCIEYQKSLFHNSVVF